MPPRDPLPWRIAFPLFSDALRAGSRAFQTDARNCIALLSPPLQILNPQHIPLHGPALLVTNHYSRPGFQAWWIALAISAAVPVEVHWMITDAWTFLGPLTPLSHWILTRIARVYGFTSTPPMPPTEKDVEARARAVRRVIEVAREPEAVIALAPEGRDYPKGILGPLPSGVGRFIEKLATHCQPILPIGVYENDESLCLSFGPPIVLPTSSKTTAQVQDQIVGWQVMSAIAQQLPPHLRGGYESQPAH
jgi:1-acyl-sn-glycerol-3-phosphate acyltransferase